MRITQDRIFGSALEEFRRSAERLYGLQQQLSTGRRVVTPGDDPLAAAQALVVSGGLADNARYAEARRHAADSLALAESALARAAEIVQSVRVLAVQAGNGTLGDAERAHLAAEIEARLEELLGVANARDAAGRYLFGGFQADVQPFVHGPAGISYQGDEGLLFLQVDAARRLAAGENGMQAFMRVRAGNGTFATAAAPANTGTGVISAGSVVAAGNVTGHDYRIVFDGTGAGATYTVIDLTSGTTLASGVPYASGRGIVFDGLQVEITGSPAPGDAFTVSASTPQSVFRTLEDLAALLRTDTDAPGGSARLASGLNAAMASLVQAEDHLLGIRASIGVRLREVDALDDAGEERRVQYRQVLSGLQDVDFAEAISELQREQLILEAAQQAFLRLAARTLFDLL